MQIPFDRTLVRRVHKEGIRMDNGWPCEFFALYTAIPDNRQAIPTTNCELPRTVPPQDRIGDSRRRFTNLDSTAAIMGGPIASEGAVCDLGARITTIDTAAHHSRIACDGRVCNSGRPAAKKAAAGSLGCITSNCTVIDGW